MQKKLIGTNPDGSPHYRFEMEAGDEHIVFTGAGMGLVQLADGTLYDVSDPVIVVESPEQATEIAHHIAVQVERSGAMDVVDPASGELLKYQHTDCDHCDAPKTADDDPLSPAAKAQVAQLVAGLTGGSAAEVAAPAVPSTSGQVS